VAINTAQFRVDTIKVDVNYPTVDGFYEIPSDKDVVTLVGFFESDHDVSDVLPVRYMEQALQAIHAVDPVTNKLTSNTARAMLSAWNAGARYIVLLKAGDLSELENLSDKAKAELIYDRMELAYEVAAGLQWSGYVVPVDVTFEGYTTPVQTVTPTMTTMRDGLSFTYDQRYNIKIEQIFDGGVAVDPHDWAQVPLESKAAFINGFIPVGEVTLTFTAHLDFARQMSYACARSSEEGTFMQGIIGTDSNSYEEIIGMRSLSDHFIWQSVHARTANGFIPMNDDYRFVTAVAGEVTLYLDRFAVAFRTNMAAMHAGLMASLPYDIAAAGRIVSNAYLTTRFTVEEADKLSYLGIITYDEPTESRRWRMNRVVCMTDQNMGVHASDFQQNVTMRLIRRIVTHVAQRLEDLIGTDGSMAHGIVTQSMSYFVTNDLIKSFDSRVGTNPYDSHKLDVSILVVPYFAAKAIEISMKAGPFNG
jgi:hypothetical protein